MKIKTTAIQDMEHNRIDRLYFIMAKFDLFILYKPFFDS